MLTIFICLLSLLPHPTIPPHPFYVSVTEIEYVDKDKVIGISCKVFNDDMETTLKNYTGAPVDIFKGNKQLNNAYLQQYFSKHFSLEADGTGSMVKVIGYEIDGEACFVYLEAAVASRPQVLKVHTDLMYDLSKSQINMIHYLNQGNRQSLKLTYPSQDVVFTSK